MNDIIKTAGRTGNAGSMYFDYTNRNVILIGMPSSLNINALPLGLTMSAWFKLNENLSTYHSIFGNGYLTGNVRGYGIYIGANIVACQIRDMENFTYFHASYNYNINTWYNLIGVVNPDIRRLYMYVNGIFIDSLSYSSLITDITPSVLTRISQSNNFSFNGNIGLTQLYHRVLNTNEIKLLSQCLPISRSGLVGEWKLNEMSGTTAFDTSGQGNHGTIVGATYSTDKPF